MPTGLLGTARSWLANILLGAEPQQGGPTAPPIVVLADRRQFIMLTRGLGLNTLTTIPPAVAQSITEDITWGIDVTPDLTGLQSVTALSGALFDQTSQTAVTLPDAAGLAAGNVITQRIRVGALNAGHQYRLTVTFTPSGTTDILTAALGVQCPF